MRRSSAILAGLFLISGLSAATAQDDGYGYRFHENGDSGLSGFAGLRGSLAFSGETKTTVPTAAPTALRASYNTGGGGSVYVGTRLPLGFRLELEALYRYLPLSSLSLAGAATTASGRVQMGAPMVNLLWDLPVPDFPFRPFIGGGVGGAFTDTSIHDPARTNVYLTNSNWRFAYEAIGGLELPLSQSSRFTAMYRWMHVDDIGYKCGIAGAPTLSCKSSLSNSSVDLGLEMDM